MRKKLHVLSAIKGYALNVKSAYLTSAQKLKNFKIRKALANTFYITSILILTYFSYSYVNGRLAYEVGTNPLSRIAAARSLVLHQTFAFQPNECQMWSKDSFTFKGETYSTKPIVYIFYTALVLNAHYKQTGDEICGNSQTRKAALLHINYYTALVPHMILLAYFLVLCHMIIRSRVVKILTYGGVAVGYIGVLYATVNNRHSVGAMILTAIFVHFIRIWLKKGKEWDWSAAGFFIGLLAVVDPPSLIYSVLFSCILFIVDYKKYLIRALPLALLPIGLHCVLMFIAFGTVRPATYALAGGIDSIGEFIKPFVIDQVSTGGNTNSSDLINRISFDWRRLIVRHRIAYNMTFGHHGIFITTPLLLLGFIQVFKSMFSVKRDVVSVTSKILIAGFTVLFVFYTIRPHDYGGGMQVIRWLIPVMPVFILFAGVWLDRNYKFFPFLVFFIFLIIGNGHLRNFNKTWETTMWRKHPVFLFFENKERHYGAKVTCFLGVPENKRCRPNYSVWRRIDKAKDAVYTSIFGVGGILENVGPLIDKNLN